MGTSTPPFTHIHNTYITHTNTLNKSSSMLKHSNIKKQKYQLLMKICIEPQKQMPVRSAITGKFILKWARRAPHFQIPLMYIQISSRMEAGKLKVWHLRINHSASQSSNEKYFNCQKKKEAGQEHSKGRMFLWTLIGLVHKTAQPEILHINIL